MTVMRECAGTDRNFKRQPEGELAKALAMGDSLRTKYYGRRLAALRRRGDRHKNYAKALIPLLRERGGKLDCDEVFQALTEGVLDLDDNQATTFLESAKHSGLLALDEGEDAFHLVVPTFAGFIMGEAGPPTPPAKRPRERKGPPP